MKFLPKHFCYIIIVRLFYIIRTQRTQCLTSQPVIMVICHDRVIVVSKKTSLECHIIKSLSFSVHDSCPFTCWTLKRLLRLYGVCRRGNERRLSDTAAHGEPSFDTVTLGVNGQWGRGWEKMDRETPLGCREKSVIIQKYLLPDLTISYVI